MTNKSKWRTRERLPKPTMGSQNRSHSLCTPMVVRSLYMNKDPFKPQDNDKELLGFEVLNLSAIGQEIVFHLHEDIAMKSNASYLSDLHNGRSQTKYLLTCGGI
ncbi:hypothetical protein CR513_17612, partial [Mucuna pruriens]